MSVCSYKNCHKTQIPFSSTAFFQLPKDHRRGIWIENSGNAELLDLSINIRKVFCETHFETKYIRRQFNRTLLRKEAVPIKYKQTLATNFPCNITGESQKAIRKRKHEYITKDNIKETATNTQNIDLIDEPTNDNNSEKLHFEITTKPECSNRDELTDIKPDIYHIEEIPIINFTDPDELCVDNDVTHSNSDGDISLSSIIEYSESPEPPELIIESHLSKNTFKTIHIVTNDTEQTNYMQEAESPQCKISPPKKIKNTDSVVIDTNSEDTYFALSLVGSLQRLLPHKRAIAKLNILRYLTELEYGEEAILK